MYAQPVEFYVACNPPLLPSGVHRVMEDLQGSLFQEEGLKVLEILYEPSGPWFKVITYPAFQAEVTDTLVAILAALTEQNTVPLEQPEEYLGSLADVRTTSLEIPWSAFLASPDYADSFVPWQFPLTMQDLALKIVWPPESKALEFNLTELLRMQARLDGSHAQDPKIGRLGPLMSCIVSCNIRETMLYIGTDGGPETLNNAREILETLLDLTKLHSVATQHVICSTESNEQFSYRWLSHIGLDSRTFPQRPTDQQRLRRAVSVRAVTQDSLGRWVTDRTQYKTSKRNMGEGATSSKELTASFLQLKYTPKSPLKNGSNFEILPSFASTSSKTICVEPTMASRPEPGENFPSKSHTHTLIDEDQLINFDADDVVESVSQSRFTQHNQSASFSLLDDDPPVNLDLLTLSGPDPVPKPPEPKRAKVFDGRIRPHIVKLLEQHLRSAWPVLSRCPGFVAVHLQFGRFYLTDLSSADVDIGSGPHRNMTVLLRELQSVEREQIGFSSTLSTIRSDEDTMVTYPTSQWVLSKRDVIYQVQCTLDDQQLSVEIDAKTFEFSCRGPVSELAGTLVHCVHQAWDMKMVVQHSSNLSLSPAHRLMGQVVTNSLHV
ncbi:hypothetical protein E4U33_002486, partial [Claviceps sp. LM78 group G4]